jgi:hypothetical protein
LEGNESVAEGCGAGCGLVGFLQPCGHAHTCHECALALWRDNHQGACPVCRVRIEAVLRAYM